MNTTKSNSVIANFCDKHNTNEAFRIIYDSVFELLHMEKLDSFSTYYIRTEFKKIEELDLSLLTKKNMIRYEILKECLYTEKLLLDIEQVEQLESIDHIKEKKEYLTILSKCARIHTRDLIGFDIEPVYKVGNDGKIKEKVKFIKESK